MSKKQSDKAKVLLGTEEAKVISTPTVSFPAWGGITPRWICRMFMSKPKSCIPVEGGVYRVNQLSEDFLPIQKAVSTTILDLPLGNLHPHHSHIEGSELDVSTAKYQQKPLELHLQPIQAVVKIHTRLPDLYSNKHDQLFWQLYLGAQSIYESKENLIYNHPEIGLLKQCKPKLKISLGGPPMPDLLDEMLSRIWKRPDAFFMHMEALQAFQSECNKLGIALETTQIFDTTFTCWRGLPIFPTNKLYLLENKAESNSSKKATISDRLRGESKTNVMLMRFGEQKQGCVSLFPQGKEGSKMFPLIDVQFMGIDSNSVASYLLTTYFSIGVLTPGALCVAEVII